MAETLRDLGVVVDHPAPNVYEVAVGRRGLAVRAARGGGQDARQLHPARPAPRRASVGSSSATRAATGSAGGRSTCTSRRCAPWAPRSSTATATTSPARPAGCAAARSSFPMVSVMGTENAILAATLAEGTTIIRPAAQEPEVDDLIAFLRRWAPTSSAPTPDTIEVEGQRRLARRRRTRPAGSHRGRHLRRRGGRDRRPRDPRGRAVRPPRRLPRGPRHGRRLGQLRRRHHRGRGRAHRQRRLPRASTSRRRPTRAWPPTSSRRPSSCSPRRPGPATSTRRSSRTASSGWPSCAGWAPRSRWPTATTPR